MWCDRESDIINALDDLRMMLREWRACNLADFLGPIECLCEAETYLTEALAEIEPKAEQEMAEESAWMNMEYERGAI